MNCSETRSAPMMRCLTMILPACAAAMALLLATSVMADDRPTPQNGSTAGGSHDAARMVETGLGPAPFFTLKDEGADFLAVGTTTRASTGIAEPFALGVPAPPGPVVKAYVQWNWLHNGAPPAGDAIVINGTTITGSLCGTGTPDLCWGKVRASAYLTEVPSSLLNIGGANTIGQATDRPVGSDPSALGEGLSILIVYRVAGGPMRSVDLYCGYTSDISGPVFGTATATLAFSNTYQGGGAHFLLNGLDAQFPTPGWEDSFFINGIAAGGAVAGTAPNANAWQGQLGPMPIDNLYDHADDVIGAPYINDGDSMLTATTTLGPLNAGDCVGHSLAAIAFDIKDMFPKWTQLPHPPFEGFNVPSNLDWQTLSDVPPGDPGPGPNITTADDFQSDGRPITCIRFWGSYIDPAFEPQPGDATPNVALGQRGNIGACCFPDGSCAVTSETECVANGGTFLGPNTQCPPNGCFGACCFGSDCVITTRDECLVSNGVFQGFGVPCDPNPCDGADCFPDAAGSGCVGDCPPGLECVPRCIEFDPDNPGDFFVVECDCRQPDECQAGVVAGAPPQCFGGCPDGFECIRTQFTDPDTGFVTICCDCEPLGACCLSDGSCIVTTASDCGAQGGSYQGDGVPCSPNPCQGETGACCLPDGTCVQTTQAGCANMNGVYGGDGSACLPAGACCLPDGSCVAIAENCCAVLGGSFIGGNCGPAVGACCFPDGTCSFINRTCCLDQGGVFQGPGVPCNNPNPCIEPPFGACCLPDGSCITVGPDVCQSIGGIYQGDNVPCTPNPCFEDPGTEIDGWLISFHTDIPADQNPGGFGTPGELLALYFAPAESVSLQPTDNIGCDGHRVWEYLVELEDTCLLHSYKDPRPGAEPPIPGQPNAFLETAGFIYWIDIEAVVGHTYITGGSCTNCTCDVDGNGVCDSLDFQFIGNCLGQPPIGLCERADINCDGVIDDHDLLAWECLAQGNPPEQCCDAIPGDVCIEVPTLNRAFDHFWGWHTSPDAWDDNSTYSPVVMGPPPEMAWIYPDWMRAPTECPNQPRVDQAFELLTPEPSCPPACPGDIAAPFGVVNVFDLLAMLASWGPCPPPCPPYCPADTNCDCVVNVFDLLDLLSSWGQCP